MAYVKKKKTSYKCSQRKTQRNQAKRKKTQAKPRRKTRSKQHEKTNHRRMTCSSARVCQLTKKARGVLGSCVEDLCKEVSSEANRLRKKTHEPTITQKVLLTALEHSMAKENVRRALTEGAKKTKKKQLGDMTHRMSCPTERQAASPKQCKQAVSPVFHKCS